MHRVAGIVASVPHCALVRVLQRNGWKLDRIPVNRKRGAIEKAVKAALKKALPAGTVYRVMHHESRSAIGLQVADYVNWAIWRAWSRDDRRSLNLVQGAIRSQIELYREKT